MLEEHPTHFLLHDGKAPFRVPKVGLSEKMHAQIRGMAGGGITETPEEHARRKALEYDEETGAHTANQPPRKTTPLIARGPNGERLEAFTSKPRQTSEPDSRVNGDMQVQRAQGGTIPGVAEGGVSRQPAPPVSTWLNIPPEPIDPTSLDFAGAQSVQPQKFTPGPSTPALPQDHYPPPPGGWPTLPAEPDAAFVADRMAHPVSADKEQAERSMSARYGRDELGIKPGRSDAASSTPAVAAPSPRAVRPGGGEPSELAAMDAASKEQRSALEAQGVADASANAEKVKGLIASDTAIKASDAAAQQRQVAARAHAEEGLRRFSDAQAEAAKIDTTLDPGRFWASRSTGGKIAGIIGLVLGALGTGPDGINRAAGMMTHAIDRDLDAQKAEHEMRLRKGGQSVDAAKSYYSMAREALGDETAAGSAAHAAAVESAARDADIAAAKTSNPQQQAKLRALSADLRQKGLEARVKAKTELETADAAKLHAAAAWEAVNAKAVAPGKNATVAAGALQQAKELEQALLSGKITNVDQMEASLELEMLKAQGGRQGPEMMALNRRLVDSGVMERIGALLSPGRTKERFQNIAKHIIATTGTQQQNAAPELDDQ